VPERIHNSDEGGLFVALAITFAKPDIFAVPKDMPELMAVMDAMPVIDDVACCTRVPEAVTEATPVIDEVASNSFVNVPITDAVPVILDEATFTIKPAADTVDVPVMFAVPFWMPAMTPFAVIDATPVIDDVACF
jgi:hypothetical protein